MCDVRQFKKLRNYILTIELMGYLHDIGKLDEELYRGHAERYREDISKGMVPKALAEIFSKPLVELFPEKDVPEWFRKVRIEGFQNHDERHPFTNLIEKIISIADNQDSKEDRGAHEEENIGFGEAFIATPFGYEIRLSDYLSEMVLILSRKLKTNINNLRSARIELYKNLSKVMDQIIKGNGFSFKLREKLLALFRDFFSLSIAETRRPANDVKLIDHAYMVGSIAKSILVACLLDESFKEHIEETSVSQMIPFKLFVVGFDGYTFLIKVNRLPDFIGRFRKLNEVKKEIRRIVEFEYPIGNLVYEDLNIMCFLVPDLTSFEKGINLLNEVRKEIALAITKMTNGLMVPVVEVYGNNDGRASKYIGPLIKNAKRLMEERIRSPYSISSGHIKDLPWIRDWEKVWMWKCNDCERSGVNSKRLEKCPRCGSNRLRQKPREKCYVCGYAPEYPIPEGVASTRGEKLCKWCHDLRFEGIARRLEEKGIIWLDQIRDEKPSNRIALIVGKVSPTEDWLNGSYIKKTTFTVFAHPKKGENKRNRLEVIKGIPRARDRKTRLHLCEKVKKVIEHSSEALELFNSEIEKLLEQRTDDKKIESLIQELIRLLSKKSASPSRLRRVWREFEEFSERSVEIAEKFFENRSLMRRKLILEVDKRLGSNALGSSDVLGTIICRDEKTIETIDYLDVVIEEGGKKLDEMSEKEINDWLVGKEIRIDWEDGREEKMRILRITEVSHYIPLVPIYKVAGEFMFLCPGKYALEIASLIRDEFYRRFNKVLGRLTLNIGIVYFKYKLPLYLVLDAGRRLIKEFERLSLKEEKFEVKKKNEHYIIPELMLCLTPKLGDNTDDWYYSTVKIAGAGKDEYTPLLEISKDAEISFFINHFDYEYMESTQNRFNIRLNTIGKREHRILGKFGPRPYKLEDINMIFKLWNLIDPDKGKLTTSEIRKLEYICASKIEEWRLKSGNIIDDCRFKKLVEALVRNICEKLNENEKRELIESILNGVFFDVVELFLTLKSSSPSPFTKIFKYTRYL